MNHEIALTTIGSVIYGFGLLVWIAGEVMFLTVAYRRSFAWFFGCLFIPFVDLAFFLLNVKQTWKQVLICLIGFFVTGFGYWLGGFHFLDDF
jgi:hypothetical protein